MFVSWDWTGLFLITDLIPCLEISGTVINETRQSQNHEKQGHHSDAKNHRIVEAHILSLPCANSLSFLSLSLSSVWAERDQRCGQMRRRRRRRLGTWEISEESGVGRRRRRLGMGLGHREISEERRRKMKKIESLFEFNDGFWLLLSFNDVVYRVSFSLVSSKTKHGLGTVEE